MHYKLKRDCTVTFLFTFYISDLLLYTRYAISRCSAVMTLLLRDVSVTSGYTTHTFAFTGGIIPIWRESNNQQAGRKTLSCSSLDSMWNSSITADSSPSQIRFNGLKWDQQNFVSLWIFPMNIWFKKKSYVMTPASIQHTWIREHWQLVQDLSVAVSGRQRSW